MAPIFTVPRKARPGLLERKIPFGKLKGVAAIRDKIEIIPSSEWPDLIASEDNPSFKSSVWHIFNQGRVGSCAKETADGANMAIREYSGRERVLFNPWPGYYLLSPRDNGSSLDENVTQLMDRGSVPDSAWPRYDDNGKIVHRWNERVPDSVWEKAYLYRITESSEASPGGRNFAEELVSGAYRGLGPFSCGIPGHSILGLSVTDEGKANLGMIRSADAVDAYIRDLFTDPRNNVRSVELVRDTLPMADKYLIPIANSWDTTWGEDGFGWVRLGSLMPAYGAFFYRNPTEA